MSDQEQEEVIAFLSRAASYGTPDGRVERIDTHGSLVFLHGARAYKLKRAVAYAALDYRRLDSREQACRAELRLNRRTAPDLYLAVRSINRGPDGALRFDGAGPVLDWVVVMRRFPQAALFDNLAVAGQLTDALIDRLGAEIARFHAGAELTPQFGGPQALRLVIEENHRELCRYPELLDPAAVNALHRAALAALEAQAAELDRRRRAGRVRRCHGDLRLANVCLLDGRPTPFDGIEFSDRLSCIDVLHDLAFLLLDLQHHGLDALATRLLHSYLAHAGEPEDCRPLPLFLALRAATRSFTLACSARRQRDPARSADKARQARALLARAAACLRGDGLP
ncbi:phosphotransferase [Azotobacter chroococcum]|uniref:Phosphotransferase n=1 Tax=Azotobacter chroococcum TaxID=353 RepID=A0AA43ZBC2_9GAMM|nr:phosphotransferase [Azotobacter chroococcum]NHN79752.1 phosphotransferase [Azotobacter chroococcum]